MNIENSALLKYFTKRRTLNDKEILFLREVFEVKYYKTKDVVLKKGEICKFIYFIEKGILKTCFTDEEQKEFINGIAIENNFCTSVASFVNQVPSTEEIVVLEDVHLLAISFNNFKRLTEEYPIYKEIYIKILEDYLTFMTWRIESVSLMSAQEKYKTLMLIFPKLFLRVSNHEMAKYLAMSPETLSRMKSKK